MRNVLSNSMVVSVKGELRTDEHLHARVDVSGDGPAGSLRPDGPL